MSPLPWDLALTTLVRRKSAPACPVACVEAPGAGCRNFPRLLSKKADFVQIAESSHAYTHALALRAQDCACHPHAELECLELFAEPATQITESARTYTCALVLRAYDRACHRQAERERLEAINRLHRFGLRVIAIARRWKRIRAATTVQRHTRGLLQRFRIYGAGADHLSTRQFKNQEVTDADFERFLNRKKTSPESRVALTVLERADGCVDPDSWRPEAFKTLANLEYERDNLIGMKATKDFLRNLRSNMISRIAFKEEICFPPLFLVGNAGCGKRWTAQLIQKELVALELCGGDGLEEVRNYADLEKSWQCNSFREISKVVYISDIYDHEDRDWNVTMKITLRALPKAALIFGFEDQAVTQRVFGCIIKQEPVRLVMPPLTAQELAELTVHKLKARGYTFAGGLSTDVVLEVVKDQWTTGEIESRNGHLANIMMNRVIQNKNDRVPLQYGKIVNPAVLTPADFGVTESSKMQLEKQKLKLINELDSLPGFGDAKKFLHDVRRRTEYVQAGGNPCVLGSCMNLVLTGNPGTGKTTFARLLFRILRSYGVLKRDAFVEMNALELKGKYIGWTTPQVVEAFRSARGGALFLDEAYALCAGDGESDSFSSEVVHTLLTEIENNRSEVLVIIAGYKDKINNFLAQDPGLSRRFPLKLNLPDYSPAELALIAEKVSRDRFKFEFDDGLVVKLERHIEEEHRSDIRKHNAALAVTLVERAVERMTCRLVDAGADAIANIGTLTAADFEIASASEAEKAQEKAMAKIEEDLKNLVGMESPKMYLNQLRRKIEFVRLGGCPKVLDTCMNLVLTGNPGTGKTTFARLLFRFLLAHGVLKKDIFVERNVLELKGQYCGQTAPKIKAIFEMAVGGCLFLDEAYALTDGDQFSNEAVRMLLTEVENRRTEVLVVLAGYEDRMAEFMKADPGLARRFPKTINLPDYGAKDIARIASGYATNSMGVPFGVGLEQSLGDWLKPLMASLGASKFNGGLAVNLTEQAIARLADRAVAVNPASCGTDLLQLTTADFGFGLNVMD